MKQMRNYGYTRMVANKRWPEIAVWSHTAIGFFPWLVVATLLAIAYGALNGGLQHHRNEAQARRRVGTTSTQGRHKVGRIGRQAC